ncbi:DUF802 domain-containing protein [Dyella halodurans]|uniref:DUF802 domain-containing protein n=1 Tax=Dyella halodurans TaxID=1920171 RepID=A0ABV9BZG4_9GAMM|nr:DUF802 domain-containing protein [Dyella halodurans]
MFRNLLNLAVFSVGLAAVCWIGAGYVGSNPLGAAVAGLIGVCYVAGALELYRYRQATTTLHQAVTGLSAAPASLGDWLERLHPSLRNATRLRIEGERVAMPAPALTPYLVGLLVLLGMLGTLLGMMATLRGTGMALESATDLQAIRGSLAAPVKGLGFAFGTSIAGVATSAMLGLLSALCRRERLHAVQLLDVKIATSLRGFSQSHQREQAFKLLQQQTEAMPALIDRLQTMMATIEQHSVAAGERQATSQAAFHANTETVYTRLAASVEQSLQSSVAESARAASSALQPVVESTMAGLARETAALHDAVAQAVQRQLEGLSAGFATTTTTVADIWNQALVAQRQSNEALAQDLRITLERFSETFEQSSAGLLDGVATRLDSSASSAADAWNQALSRQDAVNEALAARNQQALAVAASTFEEHAASLVRVVQQSHADLQAALESRDESRLTSWAAAFASMTDALGAQWQQAGEHAAGQQQAICDTLAQTSHDIAAQSRAHASDTISEISRLVQAASEAPKAAAEVIAELRQKLSDSMVRDTAMLDERSRLLATVETLLDAVNHASTEQRTAVDALVTTSADLLDRVSTRFSDHIEAETGKLGAVAAQVTGSAIEVASLGDAFGVAVQLFGQSNEALMERLQQVASALDNSLARSDEQLAYYVAQAREVIDLSMLSQQQIIEELQQLAGQRAAAEIEAA